MSVHSQKTFAPVKRHSCLHSNVCACVTAESERSTPRHILQSLCRPCISFYFAKYFHGTFLVPKIFQRNIFSPKNISAEHFTSYVSSSFLCPHTTAACIAEDSFSNQVCRPCSEGQSECCEARYLSPIYPVHPA